LILFLVVVMLIWGGMHALVLLHVKRQACLKRPYYSLLVLGFAAAMPAGVGGIVLERLGHHMLGRIVGLPGMVWAGFFFLLFSITLCHYLYNGTVGVLSLAFPGLRKARLRGRLVIAAEVALAGVITVYGFFEALNIRPEYVQVRSELLPAELSPLRVVQITDVHLGLIVGRSRLRRMLDVVERSRPDVLVSTGDLVDATMRGQDGLADMLAGVDPPLGKYACTGNHEFYAGSPMASAFTRRAGFTLLSNKVEVVRPGFAVAGVDDRAAIQTGARDPWEESSILAQVPGDSFLLLLKHRPFVERDSLRSLDLQLSGHTHRGQIFPFNLLVAAVYDYGHGLTRLEQGKHVYLSRGTGTWGPPIRFLSPPEVTVIDVIRVD
jgi:predicted MPP superfamily phosphohydrolase